MKRMPHTLLIVIASLFATASPAKATLYLTNNAQFGPNSVAVDTSTGLGWLRLTETVDVSYNQALTDMQPGGIFSDFRYASAQEVLTLYNSAGIPSTGYYPLSSPSINTLISLMGPTGIFEGEPEIIGNIGGPGLLGRYQGSAAIYASYLNASLSYLVTCGTNAPVNATFYDINGSAPWLGNWLVTQIPEPSDTAFFALVATWLIGVMIIRSKCPHY